MISVEVRSSGPYTARLGVRDVCFVGGAISNWIYQVVRSEPFSGVAITIRREP